MVLEYKFWLDDFEAEILEQTKVMLNSFATSDALHINMA